MAALWARVSSPPTVLCLGFDLFFRPKLYEAGQKEGVAIQFCQLIDAPRAAKGMLRVVADASAPGVEDALRGIRAAHPDLAILACFPHVEEDRATRLRQMGAAVVTRGALNARLADALGGRL